MSIKRHPDKDQPAGFDRRSAPGAAITTLSYLYKPKHRVPRHFHEFAQVLYAASGTMTVTAGDALWVVPPERAVWIPAGVEHSISMPGALLMKSVYIRPSLAKKMPDECVVLNISSLLRELLIRACGAGEAVRVGELTLRKKRDANLIAFLLDELESSTHLPLSLSLPRDERALRVAQYLIAEPGAGRGLAQVAHMAGASKRTLERIFERETGITFGRWRQQLSLVHAVRLLGEGAKVASVAEECGYESTSAFVAMFKKRLGTTPARYLVQE